MSPWAYYSAPIAGFKPAAILLACALACSVQARAAELLIESGPGQLAGVHWQDFSFAYEGGDQVSGWSLLVGGLSLDGERDLGDLEVTCIEASTPVISSCLDGRVNWRMDEPELALEARLTYRYSAQTHEVTVSGENWQLDLEIPGTDPDQGRFVLGLDQLDLADLPSALPDWLEMNMLYGRLSGQITLQSGQLQGQLALSGGGFDSVDGLMAADDLAMDIELRSELDPLPGPFSLTVLQTAGELLLGSLYLPSPDSPLEFQLDGRMGEDTVYIDRLSLVDPGAIELEGAGRLVLSPEGWRPEEFRFDSVLIDLPQGWTRWMDGHAAAAGFGDLDTDGRIEAGLEWQAGQALEWQADLRNVSIVDPRDRIALTDIEGQAWMSADGPRTNLAWDSLKMYGLHFQRSRLVLRAAADGVYLEQPLRLPLLDGAIVIDNLAWTPMDQSQSGFGFDARIEPLSLLQLTRALGWPEFGGVLSGDFPGVRFGDDVLEVTGGIDMQAFSGRIQLTDLSIERPFGTLPALSAQVEFSRLDLLELTGAFNFGRMHGQMSGWMRGLRLLDWRPVAMDSRVFTHEDVPQRRISQRAVDNLSNLGGGGSALISGTMLRVFEDFPYRRVGLACRLSNNICYIDGVAPHESGGFYIIEGRLLPRLDIIGHRRLVDWPQLMRQLEAMVE